MKLKQPLPANRSYEQLLNHYLVEKQLADKLKRSNRKERTSIYATMYDELFSKVPDHPRLTRRQSQELSAEAITNKFSLIQQHIDASMNFLEFAPGDCRFSNEVSKHVKSVIGVDISDQRNKSDQVPGNFSLVLYDGYNLDEIESESTDIVFSDQLIEHFHPDDVALHFQLVHRLLKKGGKYIFRTPHIITGPHDVSRFFSDTPECFHLKEWTYREISKVVQDSNYTEFYTHKNVNQIDQRFPYLYFAFFEYFFSIFPRKYVRNIAQHFIPSLNGIAVK